MDAQCAPSLTSAVTNHFRSVRMKKVQEEEEGETEGSIHQQPLVTRSCYHQDRDIKKRQNTAAKLRPKVDGRILQLTAEVRWPQLSNKFVQFTFLEFPTPKLSVDLTTFFKK